MPVFCPLDSIRETRGQPVDLTGAGFVFIHKPLDRCPEPFPPWRGSDWYPSPVAKGLLDIRRITWSDVTHVVTATGRLVVDRIHWLVFLLQYAARQAGISEKKFINALIGVWLKTKSFSYQCIQSGSRLDIANLARDSGGYLSWSRAGDDHVLWDLVIKAEIRSATSCRPLGEYVLGWEHILLSRLVRACSQVPTARLLELNTDSATFHSHLRHHKELRERATRAMWPSEEKIYRIVNNPEAHLLIAPHTYKCLGEPYVAPIRSWTVYEDEDDFESLVDKVAQSLPERSVAIRAGPGCGKTTFARGLVERLEARGIQTTRVAPTHAAARWSNLQRLFTVWLTAPLGEEKCRGYRAS